MKVWFLQSIAKRNEERGPVAVCILAVLASCSNKDDSRLQSSELSFRITIPTNIRSDVVIDDRSPCGNYHDALVAEAQTFLPVWMEHSEFRVSTRWELQHGWPFSRRPG